MKYKKKIKTMEKAVRMLEKAGILVHKSVNHEMTDDRELAESFGKGYITKSSTGEMQVKLFIHIKP